jgi:HAD superfamily hydrolase (TIGR01484 family)
VRDNFKSKTPLPIESLTQNAALGVRFVMCDIDDTITSSGKLTADAYRSLWRLHDAGIAVIPVTGRSAGWCDMIVRQWPVAGIIGENGAFAYYRGEKNKILSLTHPEASANPRRLERLKARIFSEISQCRAARDQFARIFDLAIDYCEDEPHLDLDTAARIVDICHKFGARARISSIHVNAWFGEYDKLSMAKTLLFDTFLISDALKSVFYFGDSPNDEPMFGFFPLSCAVKNIEPFLSMLKHTPAFITDECGGEGFCGAVELLLGLREEAAFE